MLACECVKNKNQRVQDSDEPSIAMYYLKFHCNIKLRVQSFLAQTAQADVTKILQRLGQNLPFFVNN